MKRFWECRPFIVVLLGVFASSSCVDIDNLVRSGEIRSLSLQDPFFAGNQINFHVLTKLSIKRFTLIETLSDSRSKDDGRQVLIVSDPCRKVVICVPDFREKSSIVPVSPFSTVLEKNQEWTWVEFDPKDERHPGYSACKWIDKGLSDQLVIKDPITIDLKNVLSDNPKLTFCYVGNELDWLEISLTKTAEEYRDTLNCLRTGRVFTRFSGDNLENVINSSAININP